MVRSRAKFTIDHRNAWVVLGAVQRTSGIRPQKSTIDEDGGTLRISVQHPAVVGQVAKNPAIASQSLTRAGQAVLVTKEAMERVARVAEKRTTCPAYTTFTTTFPLARPASR